MIGSRTAARVRWALSDRRASHRARRAAAGTAHGPSTVPAIGGWDAISPTALTDAAVGAAFRAVREHAGVDLDDAAYAAALDVTTLRAIEAGQLACSVVVLDAFARAMGSDLDAVVRRARVAAAMQDLFRDDDLV